jgi:hypothetical protein
MKPFVIGAGDSELMILVDETLGFVLEGMDG